MDLDPASAAYIAAIEAGDEEEELRLAIVLETARRIEDIKSNRPQRIKEEALDLATSGYPVFPIVPKGKTPLTKNGFKDASTDPNQIEEWFHRWPEANIGLPTGLAFDVIDIDGGDGMKSMYGPRSDGAAYVDQLTIVGIALTSRNAGRHLYIRAMEGRGNKANIYPGVDYRGSGGYVVAPPSMGANGRRYQWLQQIGGLIRE